MCVWCVCVCETLPTEQPQTHRSSPKPGAKARFHAALQLPASQRPPTSSTGQVGARRWRQKEDRNTERRKSTDRNIKRSRVEIRNT